MFFNELFTVSYCNIMYYINIFALDKQNQMVLSLLF